MGLDDQGVGVYVQQGVQVEQVIGILEEPAPLGLAMADQLGVAAVASIGRSHVAGRPPARIARDVGVGFPGDVREGLGHEVPALIR
jgi:hypothetical protein